VQWKYLESVATGGIGTLGVRASPLATQLLQRQSPLQRDPRRPGTPWTPHVCELWGQPVAPHPTV